MIAVIATIETKPGGRAELLKTFAELTPKVLAEKGCIEYGPFVDLETNLTGTPRENVVTMIEKWASIEALEAHLVSPHMVAFRKATESLRLGIQLQILSPG